MTDTTRTSDDSSFLFAPDSAIWHINRERALLLTGLRVLLMQIAHPMVAEAVYQHSYVFRKPLTRLHRTLTLTLTLVYGTRAEVDRALAEIERAHRPAVGRLDQAVGKHKSGAVYNPRNPRQALWVMATLVEGAVFGYEKLVAPLDAVTKDRYYQQSKRIYAEMGLSTSYLPAHYPDLLAYMQTAIDQQEIIVSASARKVAPFITTQAIPGLNLLTYPMRRFSVALLPPDLRAQYQYDISDRELALVDRFCALSRRVVRRTPPILRYAPEYRRAVRLLRA